MSPAEPLRVGYVLKRYPRYSETFIVNEILAHEAAGLEVEVFALGFSHESHFQDAIARVRAPVNYLPAEGLKAVDFWTALEEAGEVLPGLWGALEAARGEDSRTVYQAVRLGCEAHLKDIHHLHAHFGTSATAVARLASRFAGIPYTFTAHAKDIFHESVNPDDLRRKLNDAVGVITVSDYNLRYLRENYGLASAHVERIYNGLNLDQFSYEAPHDRPPLIVSVGRLVEKKGFADLIEACGILADEDRPFSCQIIGTGPLESVLRTRIEQLGLQTRVELVGPRPQHEIARHVQSAAVFAAPCVVGADGNRDGLPTVLLEAMALGTPCVSTDVTGIPEVLCDMETGLMVPQHDPTSLAAALDLLLSNHALRVALAARARRLIEANFDIAANAARQRTLFQASRQASISVAGR